MAAKGAGSNSTSGASAKKHRGRPDRPVVCYETGEVFENYVAAAQAVGLKRVFDINRAIKAKKRAGGYH